MAARILVVDNYDSFVYNLVQYLFQLGAECDVVRNAAIGVEAALDSDGVLPSPGPGTPEEAGICVKMVGYAAELQASGAEAVIAGCTEGPLVMDAKSIRLAFIALWLSLPALGGASRSLQESAWSLMRELLGQ